MTTTIHDVIDALRYHAFYKAKLIDYVIEHQDGLAILKLTLKVKTKAECEEIYAANRRWTHQWFVGLALLWVVLISIAIIGGRAMR